MGTILTILTVAPPFLFSVILHEIAHGLAAEKLGDPTARQLGRITLNPLKHIDPMMSVLLPAILIISGSPIIFGGAKPVPVNPLYFRNPRKGMAYVAVAGPAMNFLLAGLCYLFFSVLIPLLPLPSALLTLLALWMLYGVLINVILGLFNLLPVPPLDGGRIAVGFLPLHFAKSWAKLEPFGLLIVILLLYSGLFENVLAPILELVARLLLRMS